MLADRDVSLSPPERLMLLAEQPAPVLAALRDSVADVEVTQDVDALADQGAIILVSGAVGLGELRRVVAVLRERDGLLALDLYSLPQRAALAELGGTAIIATCWWAELPVCVLGWTGAGTPDLEALVATSALVLSHPHHGRADDSAAIAALQAEVAVTSQALEAAGTRIALLQRRARARRGRTAARGVMTPTRKPKGRRKRRRSREQAKIVRRLRDAPTAWLGVAALAALIVIGLLAWAVTRLGPAAQNAVLIALLVLNLTWTAAIVGLLRARYRRLRRQRGGEVRRREHTWAETRRVADRLGAIAEDHAASRAALARLEAEVVDARATLHVLGARLGEGHELPKVNPNDQIAQTQAIVNLFRMVPVRARVPAMGGWAASPDLVALTVDELLAVRPRTVVEMGSGVSTLWMALAIRAFQLDTRIVALEHHPRFAAQTRELLERHGVGDLVEMPPAALTPVVIDGYEGQWYDLGALDGVTEVGLVLVDGPPAATGPQSRFPAVPLLLDRLAAHASIILDDVVRLDEQEVARRWESLLNDFVRDDIRLQKGAVVFRRAGSA